MWNASSWSTSSNTSRVAGSCASTWRYSAKRWAATFSDRCRNASNESSCSSATRKSSSPRSPGASQFASNPAPARGSSRSSARSRARNSAACRNSSSAWRMDYPGFGRPVLTPAYSPGAPGGRPRDGRIAGAAWGGALAAAGWPIGGALARATIGGTARVALAVVLALCVSEPILHRGKGPAAPWRAEKVEFRAGRLDPRYGWVMLPSRAAVIGTPEPRVLYAIDEWGDRAASPRGAPDPDLPSLVVAGESIAAGHRIRYEDTFAAGC